jgi:hypothetical protein
MSNPNELERLKRLRDQQIATRYDPDGKKARYEKISMQRRRGTKITVGSVLKDIPDKVWWALIGGLIGLVFTLIILRLPGAPSWGIYIGLAGIAFGLVIGWLLGRTRDTGKDDWYKKR